MKRIKYFLVVLAVSVLFLSTAYSQEGRFGLSYNTALPLGGTADFIGKYSWRGFGMEGRWEVSPQLFIGFNSSWNVFYDTESGTFTEDTRTLTGAQYRYLNSVPVMMTLLKSFGSSSSAIPYAGIGVGTIYSEARKEMGLWQVVSKGWQVGLAPEVGVLFPMAFGNDVFLSIRYNYGFKTSEIDAVSTLGINLGLLF